MSKITDTVPDYVFAFIACWLIFSLISILLVPSLNILFKLSLDQDPETIFSMGYTMTAYHFIHSMSR